MELFVDAGAVQQLVRSLTGIHDSLAAAGGSFSAGAAAAGSDEVADALLSFGRGWRDGRKTITDEVHALAAGARNSAEAYLDAERHIIDDTDRGGINTGAGA